MKWALKQKRTGFTVVELLIVIVIVAILATLTIVGYNNITGQARKLAIPNSLDNAASEMQRLALRGPMPTTLPTTIKPDKDVVLQLAGSAGGTSDYCINAYRISSYEVSSYDSKYGKVQPFLCPGVLIGSPLGGSIPAVPLSTNLIATDFADWKLTGSVTYNKDTKELTFNGTSGVAVSPPVRLAGASTSAAFTYELYSTTASTNFSPQAGTYSGSAYYGSNGITPATSSAGYTTNGNAQAVPLNAWTARTWVVTTGPNVQYIRFNINLAPSSYTSGNFKVRNPSIERRG